MVFCKECKNRPFIPYEHSNFPQDTTHLLLTWLMLINLKIILNTADCTFRNRSIYEKHSKMTFNSKPAPWGSCVKFDTNQFLRYSPQFTMTKSSFRFAGFRYVICNLTVHWKCNWILKVFTTDEGWGVDSWNPNILKFNCILIVVSSRARIRNCVAVSSSTYSCMTSPVPYWNIGHHLKH